MKFAYADPPYLGLCSRYGHFHGDDGRCWDDLETHRRLIGRLCRGFPDGWALSLSSTTLQAILPLCPDRVRVGAWVKPFCSWKPNQRVPYTWEPVIFNGGRPKEGREVSVRDHLAASVTLRTGFTGAKPVEFGRWVLGLLGVRDEDEVVDLYVGSGAVTAAWSSWRPQRHLELAPSNLEVGSRGE